MSILSAAHRCIDQSFIGLSAMGLIAGVALFVPPVPAHAALGHAYASVETDRAALGATVKSTSAGGYTLHTLALPNHGVVKEFTRADGTVFAVAWQGPGRPDLRQLLGEHFDTLQADNTGRIGRHMRRPLAVSRSDLLVTSGGHSGAFWGVALIPPLQPAGFSASSLK
jgi:hypothetical protein